MDSSQIALALGSSLTAGLNLYVTVLALGLMQRLQVLQLPPGLAPLADTWVLCAAALLLTMEFVADKVPYVDNVWDAVHTFIRVPAGALLAAGAVSHASPHLMWIAALAGGFVTLTAHSAKATTRLAVNSTPEPFTNWFLSLSEDGLSVAMIWLISKHPVIAIGIAVLLLAGFVSLIYLFYGFFRKFLRRLRQPRLSTE